MIMSVSIESLHYFLLLLKLQISLDKSVIRTQIRLDLLQLLHNDNYSDVDHKYLYPVEESTEHKDWVEELEP